MGPLTLMDGLWIAPAAAGVLAAAIAALAAHKGARRLAIWAGAITVVLVLLAAAPSLAQTAQDLVDLATRKTAAAAPSAQALVEGVQHQQAAFARAAQAVVDQSRARADEGLSQLRGGPFDPGGDALDRFARRETPPADGAIYVAVSLSMPPADLRQLADAARKAGAKLVIQGLVDGSFRQTFARLSAVFDKDSLSGVAIDPNVFRAFHVTAAPTFIAATAAVQPCGRGIDCIPDAPPNDQVHGNITLEAALNLLTQSGESARGAAETARRKLAG
jgi:conjugal transfer pilus assembly protein TrbC